MNEILNPLRRVGIQLGSGILQAFGAICEGSSIVFGYCSKNLRTLKGKLENLDEGKTGETIKDDSKTEA